MKYLYVCFLFCLFEQSNAACSNPTPIGNFNPSLWKGLYYVVGYSRYEFFFSSCNEYTFSSGNPIPVSLLTDDGGFATATGTWVYTGSTNVASFTENLSIPVPPSTTCPLKIIDTDYSTFAVIWRCISNRDYIEILENVSNTTATVKTKAAPALTSMGLSWTVHIADNWNICPSSSTTTTVSTVTNPTIQKLKKFTMG